MKSIEWLSRIRAAIAAAMRRTWVHPICLAALCCAGFLSVSAMAAPVSRDEAFAAASTELPRFYAGSWNLADEMPLYGLSGDVKAFLFMFDRAQKAAGGGEDGAPAAFVAKARADLAAKGIVLSGQEPELRGEDRYATIVISADDTEPPMLRCFQGLPYQVVRAVDALALATEKKGAGSWRVRHGLMLGFFDEAFAVEPAAGSGEALVVDLRMCAVVTEKEAKARALAKQAVPPDPDLIRMSRQAWEPYRTAVQATGTPPGGKDPVVASSSPRKDAGQPPPAIPDRSAP